MHDEHAFHKKRSLSRRLIPAQAGIFLGSISMKLTKDDQAASPEFECSEELKAKKLVIEKKQRRMLSELGKTVAELKNGVYQMEHLPED